MEVTAFCIRLLINVLVLLPAQVQHNYSHKADATFPRIVPSRLQLFEYESVFVNCKGFFNDLTEWRVMRKIKGRDTICNNKLEIKGSCTITSAFSTDSGEYWCEADGKKSNTVNIVVTAGSVILESPALPVMEGDAVTLRCRDKMTSNRKADFYKDGVSINTGSTGEMTIHSVSKSHEGLYKCSISGVGESPGSWLTVRAGSVILESPALPMMEGEAVTLRCRNKMTSSNFPADFYKDSFLIRNSSTGNMTIHSVSKSDEGLYKCNIYGAGESAESWLTVREETPLPVPLWMVVTVSLVALLLLLVVGLHYHQKGASTSPPSFPTSSPLQTVSVSAETSVADLYSATYAVITKPRKAKETSVAELQEATYAVVTKPRTEKDEDESLTTPAYYTLSMGPGVSYSTARPVPSESTKPLLTEENHFYYLLDKRD